VTYGLERKAAKHHETNGNDEFRQLFHHLETDMWNVAVIHNLIPQQNLDLKRSIRIYFKACAGDQHSVS
jgi:hypothetical protein